MANFHLHIGDWDFGFWKCNSCGIIKNIPTEFTGPFSTQYPPPRQYWEHPCKLSVWEERFLKQAKEVSAYSKDPSTKVGCVIASPDNRFKSLGYNGFSRKNKDTPERLNNRDIKIQMVIHGELNAILFSDGYLDDCTIFTYPFQPCAACSSIIAQVGITKVVAPTLSKSLEERWGKNIELAKEILDEAEIELLLVDFQ